ncbi:hypothetical protein H257_09043 [Aphanomyces astaci]|uniref:Intraflagellar transport protein 46 homolog n=1 Tax=Aphanomyces astaci TaxID=112090 RepID=W4GDM0_APHAT|nr:hypothetical protein H257_09043 [Aphanomyces astaci]ETV77154.1 hypothetical protein H257_09043 [Aphanomyces astaci]|eukprot:XP_009833460.1 hypothetical protein H257_09043 [Aphanomyces astaci]
MSDPDDEENGRTDLDDQSMDEVYDMTDDLDESVDTLASPTKASMDIDDESDVVPYRRKDAPTRSVPEGSSTSRDIHGTSSDDDDDDEPPEIPGSPMKPASTGQATTHNSNESAEVEATMDGESSSSEEEYETDKQSRKDRINDQRRSIASTTTSSTQASTTSSSSSTTCTVRTATTTSQDNTQAQPKQHSVQPAVRKTSTTSSSTSNSQNEAMYKAVANKMMTSPSDAKFTYKQQVESDAKANSPTIPIASTSKSPTSITSTSRGATTASKASDLNFPPEILQLLQFVDDFHPETIEIPTIVQPFVPEYIPSIGSPYEGVHVLRPDNMDDPIGLVVLAEPHAMQSNVAELQLMLKADYKSVHARWELSVLSIENAHERPDAIDAWINSVSKIHQSQPLCQVHYTRPFPAVEVLMEVWPSEVEAALSQIKLPSAALDVSVDEYSRIVCGLLDIPVYPWHIRESLHVLFTLYQAFHENPHFAQYK